MPAIAAMIFALEMQRARASAMARALVSASPPGSITCIFAGGSLGRGEVWAAEVAGQLEIYSDLDLYVVVADPSCLVDVAAAARRIIAEAPRIDGVRFLRAPEIGVYSPGDLRKQPVRPGTVDLHIHHVLLHGDAALPASLPVHDRARIPAGEALYLLENRLMELDAAESGADAGHQRMQRVSALKSRLDVHAVHAMVAGTFASTRQERAQQLASSPPATLDAAAREELAAAYRAAADLARWLESGDPGRERDATGRMLVRAWLALARLIPETAGAPSAVAAVDRRCHAGASVDNAREVFRLRRRTGIRSWRALAAAPGLSGRSPLRTLRLDALVRRLHADGGYDERAYAAHRRYLDRLTRTFGFTNGSPEKRARDMHRVFS